MRSLLIAVGKTDNRYLSEAIDDYVGRAAHYAPLEIKIIPDIRDVKNLTHDQQREREGEQILRLLQPSDQIWLLDEGGEELTSEQFAAWIEKKSNTVSHRLVFIIGGPYGFSPAVYAAAKGKLSLSRMTFSHQMVRLIFVEQYYRALAILHHLPYHHA